MRTQHYIGRLNESSSGREREYDFSKAGKGKHYAGTDVEFHIPVYLQEDVQSFLLRKAQSKGIPLDQIVDDLLKRNIETFHALDEPSETCEEVA